MYLGTQFKARDDDDYRIFAQLGIKHVCADPAGSAHDWTLEQLNEHKSHIESFGLALDMVELPLSSKRIEQSASPDILLSGPHRDQQLESICRLIEKLGQAGIPSAKYNLNLIGIPRTERELGRGGALAAAFRWDKADQNAAPGKAGILSAEENWDRIEYFLNKVVPVATACKVRLACHPHDPYTPPGYMGVTRVLGTVDGLKRFVQTCESPYHGLNFCQGTVAEMLDNPREEINEIIRWFSERKKIFNVHFRNIRGCKLDFMETFPDEGDMDMVSALNVYKETGYPYMLMPDHAPLVSGRDPKGVAFAFCYGYIAGLLQTVKN
jgi:mannonate dehydratase